MKSGLDLYFTQAGGVSFDQFHFSIPKEYLTQHQQDKVKQNQRVFTCMICQNIVNIERASQCSKCSRVLCGICYSSKFKPHEDSKQYEMPCLCVNGQRIKLSQNISRFHDIFDSLKFTCFIEPKQCAKHLEYESFTSPKLHYSECDYVSYQCNSCNMPKYRKDLINHRYNCSERTSKCLECKKDVKNYEKEKHAKICEGSKEQQKLKLYEHLLKEENCSQTNRMNPVYSQNEKKQQIQSQSQQLMTQPKNFKQIDNNFSQKSFLKPHNIQQTQPIKQQIINTANNQSYSQTFVRCKFNDQSNSYRTYNDKQILAVQMHQKEYKPQNPDEKTIIQGEKIKQSILKQDDKKWEEFESQLLKKRKRSSSSFDLLDILAEDESEQEIHFDYEIYSQEISRK